MPSANWILTNLGRIANEGLFFAAVWHALIAIAAIPLLRGFRPSQRTAGLLLVAPLASVSVFSLVYQNPFNGLVFAALAVWLAGVASQFDSSSTELAPPPIRAVGLALIAFGWFYPQFLDWAPKLIYAVAAPTGLIPCPTLALVIGATLVAGGFSSRLWSIPLASAGLFYGLLGLVRLDVTLDIALIFGAGVLLAGALPVSGELVAASIRRRQPGRRS